MLLEQRGISYLLAVRGNEVINVLTAEREFPHFKASALADLVPEDGWKRLSAGVGAKGQRYSDWARLSLFRLQDPPPHHRVPEAVSTRVRPDPRLVGVAANPSGRRPGVSQLMTEQLQL